MKPNTLEVADEEASYGVGSLLPVMVDVEVSPAAVADTDADGASRDRSSLPF